MFIVNTWLFISLIKKGWWDYDRLILEFFEKKYRIKENNPYRTKKNGDVEYN